MKVIQTWEEGPPPTKEWNNEAQKN